jgi:hypothetical protein
LTIENILVNAKKAPEIIPICIDAIQKPDCQSMRAFFYLSAFEVFPD